MWTKRQDNQTTIYSLTGFGGWTVHMIGRNVYLNEVNGDQFIPCPSLTHAKQRIEEKAARSAWVDAGRELMRRA